MKHALSIILTMLFLAGCALAGMSQDAAVAGERSATLSFHSFDGGGPDYEIAVGSDIVACTREKHYAKRDHARLEGAGFNIVYGIRGLKPGETTLTVRQIPPMDGEGERTYRVNVDGKLRVTITPLADEERVRAIRPSPTLVIACNGKALHASLADNASARAFAEKLSRQAIDVRVRDYGDFEKVGDLPWGVERNDERITTVPGDIILYQGNKITFYYDRNTWDLTRLGRIGGATRESLLEFFGSGEADVSLRVEWSE